MNHPSPIPTSPTTTGKPTAMLYDVKVGTGSTKNVLEVVDGHKLVETMHVFLFEGDWTLVEAVLLRHGYEVTSTWDRSADGNAWIAPVTKRRARRPARLAS